LRFFCQDQEQNQNFIFFRSRGASRSRDWSTSVFQRWQPLTDHQLQCFIARPRLTGAAAATTGPTPRRLVGRSIGLGHWKDAAYVASYIMWPFHCLPRSIHSCCSQNPGCLHRHWSRHLIL